MSDTRLTVFILDASTALDEFVAAAHNTAVDDIVIGPGIAVTLAATIDQFPKPPAGRTKRVLSLAEWQQDRRLTCGTCVFWGAAKAKPVAQVSTISQLGYEPCSAIHHHVLEYPLDGDPYLTPVEHRYLEPPPPDPAPKAITMDGSGYYAALKTRDDFACNLHQPIQGER